MATGGALKYDDYSDTVTLADADEIVGRSAREDWGQLKAPAEETERFVAAVIAFRRPVAEKVALLRLKDRRLHAPLLVSVEETVDGVVISHDALNVWGAGEDRYTAVEDFAQTFIDVFESYRDTPAERLSVDASQYLEELRLYTGLV